MIETILYFVLVAVVSYLIGTINFAKIIAKYAKKKDITEVGSHNPGTMNMFRTFGFGLALATFIGEIVKVGVTCIAFKFIFPQYGDLMFFFAGLFLMLGNDFPVWSKFKGGKGVACLAGIFLFSNFWYVSLSWFVICFLLLLLIDYASVISFLYIGGLAVGYTILVWLTGAPYAWALTAIVWFMFVVMVIKHHSNIARLFKGCENKLGFLAKLKKVFSHKKGEQIIDESQIEQKPEKEIVIENDEKIDENNE